MVVSGSLVIGGATEDRKSLEEMEEISLANVEVSLSLLVVNRVLVRMGIRVKAVVVVVVGCVVDLVWNN